MAASFAWDERNGASPGVVTSGVNNVNWKNIDDATTAYSSYPITAGNNSFTKYQFGRFGGSWNQILNGYFDHTSGALGTGLTLMCQPTMTADGNKLTYATPATSTNAALTKDITSVNGSFPTSAPVVWFSATGPNGTMTASVSGGGAAYTNYIGTQLQTTVSASPGDTATVTLTLRYDEN